MNGQSDVLVYLFIHNEQTLEHSFSVKVSKTCINLTCDYFALLTSNFFVTKLEDVMDILFPGFTSTGSKLIHPAL